MKTIEARFNGTFGNFNLNVALSIPGSGITALFGESGGGKTSLLRCIAGLEQLNGGYLRVNDVVWQDHKTFIPTHRRAIGFVFQEASLFAHLNVRRNLEYGYKRTPISARRLGFDEVVAWLGVENFLQQMPHTLSGGQRQRVAIARALLSSPQLLLMDEPLANLDLNSRAEILPYLEQLHDRLDIPVIYVSHTPAEVAQLADHLVLLERGHITASGPINEMLTRPDLTPAQQDEASAVMEGRVIEHDLIFHLTQIAVPGGTVAVAFRELPIDHAVRVRILARDVSIALTPPQNTSITNVLPARVIDITEAPNSAQALVRLDLGGTIILSRITRRSVVLLDIKTGSPVYAQVKSVALIC
ncbi:MAG: modC1 [Verrucomicrobiaceae bacterium]|nr:modC1 [Verrucomicrobiaceae bacterium]